MMTKHDGTCRIISQNINYIRVWATGSYKTNFLKNLIYNNDVDICGLQEVGLAQHLLPRHDQLAKRMRDYRRDNIRMSSANNKHDDVDKLQYGGTAVFAYDFISHMVRASGTDSTGLGRWSWLQLEGHRNQRVRIVSAYNPCRTPTNHYATVYSQHKWYYNSIKKDVCPRKQFRRDLCAFLQSCQADNERIILMIDCNENLLKMHDLHSHITNDPLYLIDPIRLKYGAMDELPPTTDKGSYPIDSIFVSPELVDIIAGGWLRINNGLNDHRMLYIDISIKLLIRKYKNSTRPYSIRCLKCRDEKAVQRFNSLLAKQYVHHNTLNKLELFRSTHSIPLTPHDKELLFKIDRVCTQAVLHAERHCRKLNTGERPYTPELNRLGKHVDAWRCIVRKRLGRNVSTRRISRAFIALGLPNPKDLSLKECIKARANVC